MVKFINKHYKEILPLNFFREVYGIILRHCHVILATDHLVACAAEQMRQRTNTSLKRMLNRKKTRLRKIVMKTMTFLHADLCFCVFGEDTITTVNLDLLPIPTMSLHLQK